MRNVYFSFHYEDVWKVNIIRNSGMVSGATSAGFADRSLWEKAKTQSSSALKKLIEDGLRGTTVTAVLIGQQTASRKWVAYEIERSIARGNALLGVHINRVGRLTRRGAVPPLLKRAGSAVHEWADAKTFGEWVEDAWQQKNDPSVVQRLSGVAP